MGETTNVWRVAARALTSNPLMLIGALGCSVGATMADSAEGLLVALPLTAYAALSCLLEMQFFGEALAHWSARPRPFWRSGRVLRFVLCWLLLVLLYLGAPMLLMIALMSTGVISMESSFESQLITAFFILAWAFIYAWAGTALAATLTDPAERNGPGLGAAMRRPGFSSRLRAAGSPAGLMAVGMALYETWPLAQAPLTDLLGGALSPKVIEAAYYVPADLLTFYAVALMATLLSGDLIQRGLDRDATVRTFE